MGRVCVIGGVVALQMYKNDVLFVCLHSLPELSSADTDVDMSDAGYETDSVGRKD